MGRTPTKPVCSALLCALTLVFSSNASQASSEVQQRPEVQKLIKELVSEHKFSEDKLNSIFSQVTLLPKVIDSMNRQAEALPWHRYRSIFLKNERIEQGARYWQENAAALLRAEQKYGVPSEIIVAIIGVESRFGEHKGSNRIIDSLTTLAIDYPRRASFFTNELKEFLLLSREEGMDPLQVKGSFAGAMGKPQFISSSYRQYAVDFDGNGVRDLISSHEDAIGSVANYFKQNGWKTGEQVAVPAQVSGNKYRQLVEKGYQPNVALREARTMGVSWNSALSADEKGALIELQQVDGAEHWLALQNFYVITRYNRSQHYAMAVFQLSDEIRKRHAQLTSAALEQ
ncbi:MAG: lytic murein transglycosylase B [Gammaproteobacteria bacterium]|nr:lytic murein transglycosylase B [Gammaproteobacteria bacterium]